MNTLENFDIILDEIKRLKDRISPDDLIAAISEIISAKRVFLCGAGRSSLALRFFTMRLFHLGIDAHMVGDTVTPPVGEGDLLIVMSGSGKNAAAVSHFKRCAELGANRLLVTASRSSPLMDLCTHAVILPAPSKDEPDASIQPMASLFEQSCLLLFDAMVLSIMQALSKTSDDMYKNHATLE
jgi:6-phospho-3-hexuloisomerase